MAKKRQESALARLSKRHWAKIIILGSAVAVNVVNALKVRIMYATAFPEELWLGIFFMCGILLAEVGGAGIAARAPILEAAGRRRDIFALRLGWMLMVTVNLFEMFAIATTSNIMLNNTVGLRESFNMFLSLGSLTSNQLSGIIISSCIGFILPAMSLGYYIYTALLGSAESYLEWRGELNEKGQLRNPELAEKRKRRVQTTTLVSKDFEDYRERESLLDAVSVPATPAAEDTFVEEESKEPAVADTIGGGAPEAPSFRPSTERSSRTRYEVQGEGNKPHGNIPGRTGARVDSSG